VLDEGILAIFRVIAVTCAGLLELGFNTVPLFNGHVRFIHWNLHVRKGPSGRSLRERKLTERELLQGLSVSLREKEVYEQDFEGNPGAIEDVVFPCEVLEADGVDELVEKASGTTQDLVDRDTLCASVVWEQLDQEGYNAFGLT